jgi:hypothetical protein
VNVRIDPDILLPRIERVAAMATVDAPRPQR